MNLAKFNKLRKNCPWLDQLHHYSQKVCRASSFTVRASAANLRPGFRWVGNLECCKKNCAVIYWLNRQ